MPTNLGRFRRFLPWICLIAATSQGAEQSLNGQKFTLPEGFQVELAAAPPLIDRPISADFDEQGRLYVTESSGTNDKSDVQLANKPHRVVRLEDTDSDGIFDRRTIYADQLMFPEGALWYRGSLYVSAPPSIWKLTDTDNDGVADHREEWHRGGTLTGCANDLHGPFLGPDGWIYWCKGAWAEQTIERPGQTPWVTRAAHVFRKHPDGAGQEAMMTGGMDNPVDIAFTADGERIISSTFVQHPGGGLRDGLLHIVYGGVYGKDHAPIDNAPRTGDLMPILVHLGAAAPCGLTRYDSAVFGEAFRDNLFACLFNMHKITRHELTPSGGTFASQTTDFLVSDNIDFHPTDVLEDADGSLLVVDTGGWYKLCCPTSQLWKPDVLGAIYRVRKSTAEKIPDPRGSRIPFEQLGPLAARFLGDRRPAVRARATDVLARAGTAAVAALGELLSDANPRTRLRAVRVLSQIPHPTAFERLRTALEDGDATVRQAAGHALSLVRDPGSFDPLCRLLESSSVANRRIAAEALGRIQDPRGVRPLLEAAARPPYDRFVEHSILYALLEIPGSSELEEWLSEDPEFVRHDPLALRAALMALEQKPGAQRPMGGILRLLRAENETARETAAWIARRHPEWGAELAQELGEMLRSVQETQTEGPRQRLLQLLKGLAPSPHIQKVLGDLAGDAETPVGGHSLILKTMAESGLKELPDSWAQALIPALASEDPDRVQEALRVVRSVPSPKSGQQEVSQAVLSITTNPGLPPAVRRQALATVPGGPGPLDEGVWPVLMSPLTQDAPVPDRLEAIDVLQRATLSMPQRLLLAPLLGQLGPLEVDRLLGIFREQSDPELGRAVVAGLRDSPALGNLRIDALKSALARFPEEIQVEAQPLLDQINSESGRQKEKLAAVLERLKPLEGDVRRGQAVFHSNRAACSACHAMGYLGGSVGPDLTRIGGVRGEQDLLESILFPSLSFVRSYEPVVIATHSGKTYSGNVRSEGPDGVVLTTGLRQEVRLGRDEIEEIRPGNVSVMPSGLDQQLSDQDLADLLSFLKGAK
ncbi:MAG TPA: dehydrogenase [Planctomycetaceae bacterium]|nr:dehydrogenase [Planctomycetaceae bacterium]